MDDNFSCAVDDDLPNRSLLLKKNVPSTAETATKKTTMIAIAHTGKDVLLLTSGAAGSILSEYHVGIE